MNAGAVVMGPIPGWSNRCGATVVTSSAIDALSSVISVVSARMRLARLRSACLVAVSSLMGTDRRRKRRTFGHQGGGGKPSVLVTKINRGGHYQGSFVR